MARKKQSKQVDVLELLKAAQEDGYEVEDKQGLLATQAVEEEPEEADADIKRVREGRQSLELRWNCYVGSDNRLAVGAAIVTVIDIPKNEKKGKEAYRGPAKGKLTQLFPEELRRIASQSAKMVKKLDEEEKRQVTAFRKGTLGDLQKSYAPKDTR